VGVSGAARYVASIASASRVESACRKIASPRRFCSVFPKADSPSAVVSESLPRSSRTPSSGANRRASVSRRSTQVFFRPRSFPMAAGEW